MNTAFIDTPSARKSCGMLVISVNFRAGAWRVHPSNTPRNAIKSFSQYSQQQESPKIDSRRMDTTSVVVEDSEDSQRVWAEAPFRESDLGDCVVQSSDGMCFMAAKMLLSLASPIFREMFQVPQPPDAEKVEDKPIITLTEGARTVRGLLLPLYPGGKLGFSDVEEISELISAIDKYEVEMAAYLPSIQSAITSTPFLKGSALAALSIAWRLKLEGEIILISRYTHKIHISYKEDRAVVLKHAGTLLPLVALYQMRLEREQVMFDIVQHFCRAEGLRTACERHADSRKDPSHPYETRDGASYKSQLESVMAEPFPDLVDINIKFSSLGCPGCQEATSKAVARAWKNAKWDLPGFPLALGREMIHYS